MRRADAVHLGLMLLALGLAYAVPFELLLLSYVILGPAHYTTEISWLHERKYFLPHRGVALILAAVAIVAALIDSAIVVRLADVGRVRGLRADRGNDHRRCRARSW